ncbi:MAG: hypothetical protein J5I47_09130 [Vicingus serpentipes]|nr:hypothetical protein [Vicingus serpentipes]
MKLRYLMILMLMVITSVGFSQEKTMKAFYSGYDEDSHMYSFEDADRNYVEFKSVSPEVLKSFKLKTSELIEKAFIITYTAKQVKDEDGEIYEELSITKLQPTTLERNEEADSDDDDE